jgi:HEAT repeat protein
MKNDFKPDIWRLQAQWNVRGLVRALNDPDSTLRKRAAASLLALGALEAIPPLQVALDAEADADTKTYLQLTLHALQTEAIQQKSRTVAPTAKANIDAQTQAVIDDLRSEDMRRVMQAAEQAAQHQMMPAVETLVIIFNRRQTPIKVRLAAAEALLKMASAPVEVSLLGALRHPNSHVRRKAATILGELRAEWALEPLIRCLSDSNQGVRRAVYSALRKIDTPVSHEALNIVRQNIIRRNRTVQPRPFNPLETQQIVWPKIHIDPAEAPTKPLDPDVLEQSPHYKQSQSTQDDSTRTS